MKICTVHNRYGKLSGEEIVFDNVCSLLEEHGHEVIRFVRSSEEIKRIPFGRVRAFLNGIYSPTSRRTMRRILEEERPDIVHIHNLFPLISPSILPECTEAGIPVFMTVHNYRLVCPNGLFLEKGATCEKCSGGREYWCILKNCEESLLKSVGYAIRIMVARRCRFFLDNVSTYATLTEFQRQRFIAEGFPPDQVVVIPNMANVDHITREPSIGRFVGYVGRVSPEKGIFSLLEAAHISKGVEFKAAGSYDRMPRLVYTAPSNFEFTGHLEPHALGEFYSQSRIIVLCSTCLEGFPMALVEAMFHGKPVVCSRIGGLGEIVEDGKTGLLFDPGNARDLSDKIQHLWNNPHLCQKMGNAGREKAMREYTKEKYYERLIEAYKKTINHHN
jgi:glycosyltransferase involved in cell wall biosynthesis